MKKVAIIAVFLAIVINSRAQTDTVQQVDTTTIRRIFTPTIIPSHIAAAIIYNIGRLVFFPQYPDNYFTIAVTNNKVYTDFLRYFRVEDPQNRITIHGRPVRIVVIGKDNYPPANIVYVTRDKIQFVDAIKANYIKKPTIIVSEGRSSATISLIVEDVEGSKPKYGLFFIDVSFKYEVGTKKLFIMPELFGYNNYYRVSQEIEETEE